MTVELRRLLAEKAVLTQDRDYYGLLGVPPDADLLSLRRAYFRLFRVFAPEQIADEGCSTSA
jgi:curved DNA-binding protein CbpA